MVIILHARSVTVFAAEIHAFHESARVSMPLATGVGVASTVSPVAAPVTVLVVLTHVDAETLAISSEEVTEICFRIGAP